MNGLAYSAQRQAQLLCMAAARLRAQHPKNCTEFADRNRWFSAHVAWCGVVVVVDLMTAAEVVRSLPGHPSIPAPQAMQGGSSPTQPLPSPH